MAIQDLHLGHLACRHIHQGLGDSLLVLIPGDKVGLAGGIKALGEVIGHVQHTVSSGGIAADQEAVGAEHLIAQAGRNSACQQGVFHQAVNRIAELVRLGRHAVQKAKQRLVFSAGCKERVGVNGLGERIKDLVHGIRLGGDPVEGQIRPQRVTPLQTVRNQRQSYCGDRAKKCSQDNPRAFCPFFEQIK